MRRTCLLAACLLGACASTRVVDRAPDGTAILLCGPQPDAESLARLSDRHGLRTVVNLRGEKPGEGWFERERRDVAAVGARWVQLPVSGWEPPPPETLRRFFDLVEDPSSWPVFVHCQSGIHRSGLMCALYRRQYQGWSGEQAVQEMRKNGFRLGRGDRSAVERFVRDYEPDPNRRIPRTQPEARVR